MKSYWKYSLDHLAHEDVKAFIYKIHSLKTQELKAIIKADIQNRLSDKEIEAYIESKLNITFVGHSLGGMVLPMYLIN